MSKSTRPATKGKKHHETTEEKIETALGRTELFFQRNSKTLTTALIIVLVVVGGYFAYQYLYLHPRAEKAADSMFVAEQLFAEGDFRTALDGDGNNAGFVEVVGAYGHTRPGRLAAHYAGISYMQLGDYDSALEYLEKYKPAEGAAAVIINAQNLGLQGDIYSMKEDYAKAADMYKKAVAAGNNILTTPHYLKKLGEANAAQGNYKAALEAYQRIKSDFGSSVEARDIDKFIGAIEQL